MSKLRFISRVAQLDATRIRLEAYRICSPKHYYYHDYYCDDYYDYYYHDHYYYYYYDHYYCYYHDHYYI